MDVRTTDLESVSEIFDNIIKDAGTEEGMNNIIDNVTDAQATGGEKFDETGQQLDEKTAEVEDNQHELEETAGEVDGNIEVIKEVEGNIEDSDLQGDVQTAVQSAADDYEFLDVAQSQLLEIAEQSRQLADELFARAEAAKAKGV
jgi:hypothetical protein